MSIAYPQEFVIFLKLGFKIRVLLNNFNQSGKIYYKGRARDIKINVLY